MRNKLVHNGGYIEENSKLIRKIDKFNLGIVDEGKVYVNGKELEVVLTRVIEFCDRTFSSNKNNNDI